MDAVFVRLKGGVKEQLPLGGTRPIKQTEARDLNESGLEVRWTAVLIVWTLGRLQGPLERCGGGGELGELISNATVVTYELPVEISKI